LLYYQTVYNSVPPHLIALTFNGLTLCNSGNEKLPGNRHLPVLVHLIVFEILESKNRLIRIIFM
jgi:hypothetical protein